MGRRSARFEHDSLAGALLLTDAPPKASRGLALMSAWGSSASRSREREEPMFPAHAVVSRHPWDAVLHQPQEAERCPACWLPLGLYVVRGQYRVLCAPCTLERVERLPRPLPEWLGILEDEVRWEVQHLKRKRAATLTVSWDDLVRCGSCSGLLLIHGAKYRPEAGVGQPLCQMCFAAPAG